MRYNKVAQGVHNMEQRGRFVIAIRSQWRAFTAGASPAVYRILLHGMLYGLSFSISDMLLNFIYIV